MHAWNEVYWRALGFPSRRRAFPGHTNSEVLVEGQWRTFDTDMAGLIFTADGKVAGYDDIIRDLSLIDRPSAPWPKYPFAWPGDFNAMKRGWQQVAAGGRWYSMYGGGYAAHPGVVHLRRGETLTRFFGPDAFGDASRRRFWHRQPGGPQRDWTFVNGGEPHHDGPDSNCRGQVAYGNALFEYSPNLASESFREGIVQQEAIEVTPRGLRATGDAGSVTFEHFSPYVICGDPLDDRDPMTGPATDGFVISAAGDAPLQVFVSPDQGQTWQEVPDQEGQGQRDATELVKGRYGWQVRVVWPAGATLKSLRFVTTCQLSQALYPRLRAGGSRVMWRAANRAVVPVLPRLEDEAATIAFAEVRDLRSSNLQFRGRSANEPRAYQVLGPRPASVVFRIESPAPLVGLSAAARVTIRSPTPPGADFALSWAPSAAAEWTRFAQFTPPADNEYSSGWVAGHVDDLPGEPESALVRVDLNGGGSVTGLITAELYGLRRTAAPSAAEVTWGWSENGDDREHVWTVPAGAMSSEEVVPTGPAIVDRFVRIHVP